MNAAKLWPLAILGVLAVTVIGNGVLLYAANDRRHAAVEPDYYRKAIEWDSTLAQRDRDAALAWRLDAELVHDAESGARLVARLADAEGKALGGAVIEVEAIHNLDPEHPVRARLRSGADGRAETRIPLRLLGLWELRCEVIHRSQRFTADLRRELAGMP